MTFYCPTCKEEIPEEDVDFQADDPRHPVEGEFDNGSWSQRWHDVEETDDENEWVRTWGESALEYEIRREMAVDDEVDRRREARDEK